MTLWVPVALLSVTALLVIFLVSNNNSFSNVYWYWVVVLASLVAFIDSILIAAMLMNDIYPGSLPDNPGAIFGVLYGFIAILLAFASIQFLERATGNASAALHIPSNVFTIGLLGLVLTSTICFHIERYEEIQDHLVAGTFAFSALCIAMAYVAYLQYRAWAASTSRTAPMDDPQTSKGVVTPLSMVLCPCSHLERFQDESEDEVSPDNVYGAVPTWMGGATVFQLRTPILALQQLANVLTLLSAGFLVFRYIDHVDDIHPIWAWFAVSAAGVAIIVNVIFLVSEVRAPNGSVQVKLECVGNAVFMVCFLIFCIFVPHVDDKNSHATFTPLYLGFSSLIIMYGLAGSPMVIRPHTTDDAATADSKAPLVRTNYHVDPEQFARTAKEL